MPTQRHSIRQYHGQTEKKARCKSQEETPFLSIPPAQEVKGQPTSVYLWQLFSISLLHSRLLTLKNHSISQICLIGQLFVGSSISITFSLLVNLWGLMPELSSVDGSYKHHLSEKKITCNYPPMPINFPRKNLIRVDLIVQFLPIEFFHCLHFHCLQFVKRLLWVLVSILRILRISAAVIFEFL